MLYKTATREFRERWIGYIYDLQEKICIALSEEDGKEFLHLMNGKDREGKVAEV